MRFQLPFLILLAPLWASATPLRERIPHATPVPASGDSGSILESDTRAGADQPPDPENSIARPAYKSAGLSIALSVLGSAVPVLTGLQMSKSGNTANFMVMGGMLVGPSLGQFYAGSLGRGMLGTGIRTGGAFMALTGIVYLLNDFSCDVADGNVCDEDKDAAATPLLILGTATYLGGAIYSLLDAGWAVERYNARLDSKRGFGWSPTLAPASQGGLKPGVLAWMRF